MPEDTRRVDPRFFLGLLLAFAILSLCCILLLAAATPALSLNPSMTFADGLLVSLEAFVHFWPWTAAASAFAFSISAWLLTRVRLLLVVPACSAIAMTASLVILLPLYGEIFLAVLFSLPAALAAAISSIPIVLLRQPKNPA